MLLKQSYLEFPTSNSSTVDQVINLKSLAEGTEKENLQNTPKYFAFSNLVTWQEKEGWDGRKEYSLPMMCLLPVHLHAETTSYPS